MHIKSVIAVLLTAALATSAAPVPEPCGSTPHATSTKAPVPTKTPSPPVVTPTPTKTPAPPIVTPTPTPIPVAQAALTPAKLISIDPAIGSCAAQFPTECADAARAAPAISKSFTKYGLTTKGEQAAAIALMLFESESFKYKMNHYPGRPGQGTYNMQMLKFNEQYATSLGLPNTGLPNDILNGLNKSDDVAFGSAAWFMSTQCTPAVRTALKAGTEEGWNAYISGCVVTTQTPERTAIWRKVVQGLGA